MNTKTNHEVETSGEYEYFRHVGEDRRVQQFTDRSVTSLAYGLRGARLEQIELNFCLSTSAQVTTVKTAIAMIQDCFFRGREDAEAQDEKSGYHLKFVAYESDTRTIQLDTDKRTEPTFIAFNDESKPTAVAIGVTLTHINQFYGFLQLLNQCINKLPDPDRPKPDELELELDAPPIVDDREVTNADSVKLMNESFLPATSVDRVDDAVQTFTPEEYESILFALRQQQTVTNRLIGRFTASMNAAKPTSE